MLLKDMTYQRAFFVALGIHFLVGVLLFSDLSGSNPVLKRETINTPGQMLPVEALATPKQEIVKAVSVDSKAIEDRVNQLKAEKAHKEQTERAERQKLQQQADAAKRTRQAEEQKIQKMKQEAARLAAEQKKQLEAEQKRLNELAIKKQAEAKQLAELKKQQDILQKKQLEEAKKLEELKKKQEHDEAVKKSELAKQDIARKAAERKAQEEKVAREKAEKTRLAAIEAEAARKKAQAAAEQQARAEAANLARVAGEVDKYKALIVDAIGRQWILPDNANRSLSSQFRIRLAPNGAVLEVALLRSSGDPILDRSAQNAIYKASPLPVPQDASTFNLFREISLTVRPENIRG